jgi:hypothetical protein
MFVTGRTSRPGEAAQRAILVRRGVDHYTVPVPGLQHLEATTIHVVLADRPVEVEAAYLSPTRLLPESDLTMCLSGGSSILMAGDFNAKHLDWNSRLTTARGSILCDYANRNSCLVYGQNSPQTPTVPTRPPMSWTLWSSRTSSCRCIWQFVTRSAPITYLSSSTQTVEHPFMTHWTAPTSRERTGPHSRLAWKLGCQGIRMLTTRRQSPSALRRWPAPSKRSYRHLLPNVDLVPTRGLHYPLVFRMKYAWRPGWGGSGKSRRTPLWKLGSAAFRGRWPTGWANWAIRWNRWRVRASRCERWQRGWCEFPLPHPPCKYRKD